MASERIDFCKRNIKVWLGVLVVLALFVLSYAAWLAWQRGEISGFASRERGPGPVSAGGPAPAAGPQGVPAALPNPAAGGPAQPAVVGGGPVLGAQGVALTAPLDAITRATPNGGIQFIGGAAQNPIQMSFNQAADIMRPTVVNINAVRPGTPAPPAVDPNGARFIDPFDGVPDKIIGQVAYESVGSGVFVDPRGYVVTNNHVVAGATSMVVTMFNAPQNYLPARMVATDTANDLALLQVSGDGPFPVATLADSSLLEVGDWVLAIGNPFGLGHTVTAGIISAKRSSIVIDGVMYGSIIQTDAPINRGSSGGPLVNLQGKMVGINTAIYAPTGVFNGTGFSIPSNRVGAFVARVLGNVTDTAAVPVALQAAVPVAAPMPATPASPGVWVGVGVIDMSPDLTRSLAVPFQGGVFVSSVILDSPADEAGITRGDVIASLAGSPLPNADTLNQVVATLLPEKSVPLTVWRGGKSESMRLTPKANRSTTR
jgi:serine protease Do